MPSRTAKQHRAMAAAAHGQSTLGIPAKVGREFIRADKAKGRQFALPKGKRKAKP